MLFHPNQKISTFVNKLTINQPNHLIVFWQGKCFHLNYMIRYEDVFNKVFGDFQCRLVVGTKGQMKPKKKKSFSFVHGRK